ncbi:hypothetical protein ACP70R_004512 [Stipagrostis hirtigluma subsp. patula]
MRVATKRRRGGGGGVDRISSLPDDLLHSILLRLPGGTAGAARTSVLSRRWRRVWTGLPELSFHHGGQPVLATARAHDQIDAALAACAALGAVERLEIHLLSRHNPGAARVSRWLRFASQRLTGELRLLLLSYGPMNGDDPRDSDVDGVVTVPLFERAKAISMGLGHTIRFELPSAGGGTFAELSSLSISSARINGRELEDVLSSRCPSLKELSVVCPNLDGASDEITIRSASLQKLEVKIFRNVVDRLQVSTPMLQTLSLLVFCEVYISAPMLSELEWNCHYYDPSRHHLVEVGRHLRRLKVAAKWPPMALVQRFDTFHELNLNIEISWGAQEYERFLQNINQPVKCEVLVVTFMIQHAFKPTMLHLLRKFNGVRKLVVQYYSRISMNDYSCSSSGCPCGWLESHRTDNLLLNSLEEVEVNSYEETDRKAALVKLLCKCIATSQKRVTVTVFEGRHDKYLGEKIRSICPPNSNFELMVKSYRG